MFVFLKVFFFKSPYISKAMDMGKTEKGRGKAPPEGELGCGLSLVGHVAPAFGVDRVGLKVPQILPAVVLLPALHPHKLLREDVGHRRGQPAATGQ